MVFKKTNKNIFLLFMFLENQSKINHQNAIFLIINLTDPYPYDSYFMKKKKVYLINIKIYFN